MKIAYIMPVGTSLTGVADGVRMQALIWKTALEQKGHQVDLIEAWGEYNWKSYDVIHLFGQGNWLFIIKELSSKNPNIIVSPIIDTNTSLWKYKLASYWGCNKLRITSQNYTMRYQSKFVKHFLARSNYEKQYILASTYLNENQVNIVPLSYRTERTENILSKEEFCFHVSQFTSDRKNVMRLMEASVKYNFKLVIAGSRGSEEVFLPFKNFAEQHDNITILGYLSDEELTDYYNRAKVFALPSLFEGVGLVALEAAMHGCEIVLTRLGGPKEYYGGYAYLVNPYDIDEIGQAVVKSMKEGKQPKLAQYVQEYCSINSCIKKLIRIYEKISS